MSFISRITRRHPGVLALCATFAATCAQAQAPAAPEATVGASIKRLEFQWQPVASSNYYEFWFKANAGASFVRLSEIPASRTRVSMRVATHLLEWKQARYRVTACNASGCGSSSELSVNQQSRRATGYFKSSHPVESSSYGQAVAVSEDRATLAVSAPYEGGAGAAYVYRLSQGRWVEEARLVPGPDTGSGTAVQLSLSGDGNVLAMATHDFIPLENFEGAVYLFRREAGEWRLEQRLIGGPREEFDFFGESPDLTEDGNRLLVSYGNGKRELYRHDTGGWVMYQQLPETNFGGTPAVLSGNGSVLARCALIDRAVAVEIQRLTTPTQPVEAVEIAPASADRACADIDIDFFGNLIAVGHRPRPPVTPWDPEVQVLRRIDGQYETIGTFAPGSWHQTIGNRLSSFGDVVRLSRGSEYLAISDFDDSGAGRDIMAPPLQPSSVATGAVYVYARSGNTFRLHKMLKPHLVTEDDFHFGTSLSFGDSGRTLALGHPDESSSAFGIGGDRNNTALPFSGAAWLY